MNNPITIRNLPPEIYEQVVENAKERGINVSAMIKVIVFNFYNIPEKEEVL